MSTDAAVSWDAEYQRGRYAGEPPLPFIDDALQAVDDHGLRQAAALDIGAGNGRNLRRLLEAGLDVTALDISQVAIDQLAAEFPRRRDRFVCGDLAALPEAAAWPVVLGIQVFQHGDRATAHAHIRAAQARVVPGGLIAVRVNATATDVWPAFDVVEPNDGANGTTIRYLDGPKRGLTIHFFDPEELTGLFRDAFTPVLPLRLVSTLRTAPAPGQWTQVEAIWRRTP
ncbi:MAG: class I SAM-dependent methyltransferase [Catenulispora sp.]|nr:class I SAM-dependent methyltransferase [Catenulispora sp.]NUR57225.1 class I SAM-dependent methyltransferase [Catenulispora sp.]